MELGFHCNRLHHVVEGIVNNGLRRGEFYNLPEEDIPALKKEISRYRLDASIHCPLVRPSWYPFFPTWSYLCHMDEDKRELNFRMVTDTLERADDLGAQYVIVHYPSPLPPETAALPLAELRNIALESAYRLDKLAERQRIVIHVEGFGPHPLFTPAFLVQVMETFSHLRYCFDTGHMHLAAQRDGFDYYQFAARMAPYLGSIHMWNTRSFEDYQTFRHIPLHPSQRPEEGWVDIPRILTLLDGNGVPAIFESGHTYPEALGAKDYREGVQWVKDILKI